REALGELRPVALGDAGDQRLLAVEVDIEGARADRGLLADVVHGGAVEAGVGEATLGGFEDVLATRALDIGLELGHWDGQFCWSRGGYALAVHKIKRTPVLFARNAAASRQGAARSARGGRAIRGGGALITSM